MTGATGTPFDCRGTRVMYFGLHFPMALPVSHITSFSPLHAHGTFVAGPDAWGHAKWETRVKSLTWQQFMTEITKTKFFPQVSITPVQVDFWRRHLEELSQRLVALSLGDGHRGGDGNGAFFSWRDGRRWQVEVGAYVGAGAYGMYAYNTQGPKSFIRNSDRAPPLSCCGQRHHASPPPSQAPCL